MNRISNKQHNISDNNIFDNSEDLVTLAFNAKRIPFRLLHEFLKSRR